jgi:hypothetical protein
MQAAGRFETLSEPSLPWTVFVPSNGAINDALSPDELKELMADSEFLAMVRCHMAAPMCHLCAAFSMKRHCVTFVLCCFEQLCQDPCDGCQHAFWCLGNASLVQCAA